ncbi:diguanylate cyclase [Sulfurimonas hongkongensis]|uniref:Diguanylate cyclase n=1 Tax=Sulfurimonas hongkongensis TaxID=1172190 RepID=T0L465_9BACT|nr:EAL domain-containing protein [Sulfurimonas hongkongensis]EQB40663.1 diguanylate cyclase [Sulfurimonas hongkongensis]
MSFKIISKKLIIIIPIIFLVIALARVTVNYFENKASVEEFISQQAKLVDSLYLTHRDYYQDLYLRDIIHLDEKTLLGLPAYSAVEISKNFSQNNKLHIEMQTVSDKARNPKNQADEYELRAIEYFRNNPNEDEYFEREDEFYQYATPLKIEQKCLSCHGEKSKAPKFISEIYDKAYNHKLGEIRGILSVKVPTKHVEKIINKQFFGSLLYDLLLIIVISIIAFYFIKYFSNLQRELEEELEDRTKELKNSLSFLESYKDAIDSNLIVSKTDLDGNISYINENFCEISGYTPKEIIGQNHNVLRDKTLSEAIQKRLWRATIRKGTWSGRLKNIKKDGSFYWVDATIAPITDAKGKIKEYISIRHDVTELVEQKNELKLLANTDPLTKLGNRNALKEESAKAKNLSLILANIDSFSQINDFYGHELGDEVLVEFAKKLRELCEANQNLKIYRVSGDEFAILARDMKAHSVVQKAQDIVKFIDSHIYEVQGETIELSATLSISFEEKDNLHVTADMALKIARREAKDLIVYDKSMSLDDEYENNMLWTKRIKDAIKNDRIILYFQSIVDNNTLKTNKYESLIRLVDEHGNVITPYFFLEIAKKAKLYKQLTKIVVQKSFENFRENDFDFSINLSIDDILDKEISEYILEMLAIYNISDRVIFEIVESESIENFYEIQKFIKNVKLLGCRIAIDDFGTGYSNFEYLMRLEADFIKIDGTIIKEIVHNKNSEIITKVIIDFAKRMNIEIIAEYVENEKVFKKVKELGIENSQGYYFSEPKPTLM